MGVDATVISHEAAVKLERSLAERQISLTLMRTNLIDQIWSDRPGMELHPIFHLPVTFSGRESQQKITSLRETLSKENVSGFLITALDEIACRNFISFLFIDLFLIRKDNRVV